MIRGFIYFLFLACAYSSSFSQDVKFTLPLHGTPGKDFFIDYYMDHDPFPTLRDAYCGTKTYEGHTGTDFCIRSFKAMDSGVYVYAVADGAVMAAYDGMYDRNKLWVSGGYGNHIIILHGDNYKTTYAHLAKKSIMVKQGDYVKAGQPIAKVGSSGYSKGPHLHLEVNPARHPDSIIDPFTGSCQAETKSLWVTDPPYDTALYVIDQGFVPYLPGPGLENLQERWQLRDSFYFKKDAQIVYWIQLHGLRKGNVIQAKWINPRGYLYAGRKDKLLTDEWYVYHWATMKVPRLKGTWTLQYYVNDKLIATRDFFVAKRQKSKS